MPPRVHPVDASVVRGLSSPARQQFVTFVPDQREHAEERQSTGLKEEHACEWKKAQAALRVLPRWRQPHCRFNQRMLIFLREKGANRQGLLPLFQSYIHRKLCSFPLTQRHRHKQRPSRSGAASYIASSKSVRKQGQNTEAATISGTISAAGALVTGSPDRHNLINWRPVNGH